MGLSATAAPGADQRSPARRARRRRHRGDDERATRARNEPPTPNFYFPLRDVADGALDRGDASSFCEFKGRAHYFAVRTAAGDRIERDAAWGYDQPSAAFADLVDHVAFYAQPMDACFVDGELVVAQPGGFYGGWITSSVVGPFKGGPGTRGW